MISKDRGEAMAVFMPIFFAFGLILMIGCANVANLLLARGLSRHREIGVRLSLGATRGRIVRQLLTENLLMALAAAALGFLVSRALLAGSVHLALSILPPEFVESMDVVLPPGDWRVWTFLFGGAFVSTVMFGLAPALHSTRLELVRATRGEVTRDARPSRVRHMLIGSQVTASALLLVCAAVFLRSTYSAATADVGVRADDTVMVAGITESARPALLHAVKQHPSIASVAASWPQPMGSGESIEATVDDTTLGRRLQTRLTGILRLARHQRAPGAPLRSGGAQPCRGCGGDFRCGCAALLAEWRCARADDSARRRRPRKKQHPRFPRSSSP